MAIDQEDADERLPDEIAGDIINIVQRDYLRRRESKLGEHSEVLNAVASTPDYTWPTGFSKPRKIWYLHPSTNKIVFLEYLDKDEFDAKYPYSSLASIDGAFALILAGGGTLQLEGGGSLILEGFPDISGSLGYPKHYTMWQGKFVLGPCPDATLVLFVDCYRMLPDLADNAPNNENRFTREAWEYLLFASLVKAAEFGYEVEGDRLAFWEKEAARFERSLDLEDTRQVSVARASKSVEPG